jgi:predicted dehydrogenase
VRVGVAGEIAEFCAAIAGGRDPWPSAEESTSALAIVMAYYQAAANGVAVAPGGANGA